MVKSFLKKYQTNSTLKVLLVPLQRGAIVYLGTQGIKQPKLLQGKCPINNVNNKD